MVNDRERSTGELPNSQGRPDIGVEAEAAGVLESVVEVAAGRVTLTKSLGAKMTASESLARRPERRRPEAVVWT